MPIKPPPGTDGESQSDWMSRCVSEMMEGGDREQEQAVAACLQQWRDRDKEKQFDDLDVPSPDEDEDEATFMDRCTSAVVSDNDVDEATAEEACELAWEERAARGVHHKTHAETVQGMEFVLSDETPDRLGDVIMSSGWDLTNFRKNPIALWNHLSSFPIGRWRNLRIEKGGLRGKLELAPAGTSDRIDEIRKLIDAGILKAVSVGFRPIESKQRKSGDRFLGDVFLKQELVETSLVSVPANPNALAIAKSLQISDDTLNLVFAGHGNRSGTHRRVVVTGKHAETTRRRKSSAMSLAQRIKDAEGRITDLRDQLVDHLKNVDDSNVTDAQLEITNELNAKIAQEEKGLTALKQAERHLAASSERDREESLPAIHTRVQPGRGNGNGMRPFNIPAKKVDPLDYLVRAGTVALFAHRHKRSTEDVLETIAKVNPSYNDEATRVFIDYIGRAATAPAMTTVTGWAAELVETVFSSFMETLMPKSVFPRLSSLGLSLTFGRAGRISIPTRSRTPTVAGSFVGEGQPIPVRQGAFTAQILTPKKMAIITLWSREMDEHSVPAIEGLLRNAIQEDTAVSLDSILLDANPATVVRPAGLLNGVAALPATAGGGFNALVGDIKQLSGAILTNTAGNIRSMAWLMNPQQVMSASLTALPGAGVFPFADEIGRGQLRGYPIIDSGTVPLGTVITVDAADFVVVGGEAPRFEISDQATLHLEDTTPQQISSVGTPATVAAPITSLFQTDSLALRLILPVNWALRRTGVVAWTQAVTW